MEIRPSHKQTEVGVIPEEWAIMNLEAVCWFQEGPGVRTHQFRTSGVKLLNGTNISNGQINLDTTTRHISNDEARGAYKHFLVEDGDILVATSGITIDKLHEKVAFARADMLPLCMNTSTVRFKASAGQVLDYYLYFFLQSDLFKSQISRQATGSAQLNFGPSHLRKVVVPVAKDLVEQRAIAGALKYMDELLGALTRLIAKKRDLKQAAMQQLLTGQTRLPGFSGEWKVKRLGDAAEVVMGQSPIGSSYNRIGFGVPLINGPTEFTEKHPVKIQWTLEPTKICKKGDLLLCVRGSSTGRINIADDEYCIGRGIAAIRAKSEADTTFITFQVFGAVQSILAATTGSTFPNIDGKSIKGIEVPLPLLSEQTAIAAVLADMDAEVVALEDRLAKTRALKQGMMQELLTGRTRLV